jgi:hypothetical protein
MLASGGHKMSYFRTQNLGHVHPKHQLTVFRTHRRDGGILAIQVEEATRAVLFPLKRWLPSFPPGTMCFMTVFSLAEQHEAIDVGLRRVF